MGIKFSKHFLLTNLRHYYNILLLYDANNNMKVERLYIFHNDN